MDGAPERELLGALDPIVRVVVHALRDLALPIAALRKSTHAVRGGRSERGGEGCVLMGVYDQSKISNAPSRGGSGGRVLKPPGYPPSTVVRRGLGLPSSPMLGLGSDTVRLPLKSERWLAKPPPPCLLGFLARAVTGDPHLHPPPSCRATPACPRILHLLDWSCAVWSVWRVWQGGAHLGENQSRDHVLKGLGRDLDARAHTAQRRPVRDNLRMLAGAPLRLRFFLPLALGGRNRSQVLQAKRSQLGVVLLHRLDSTQLHRRERLLVLVAVLRLATPLVLLRTSYLLRTSQKQRG